MKLERFAYHSMITIVKFRRCDNDNNFLSTMKSAFLLTNQTDLFLAATFHSLGCSGPIITMFKVMSDVKVKVPDADRTVS